MRNLLETLMHRDVIPNISVSTIPKLIFTSNHHLFSYPLISPIIFMISTLLVIISYIISRYYLHYIHFMVVISILKDPSQRGPGASTAPRLPRARSTSLSRASPPRSTKQQATWRQELPKASSSEPRSSLGAAKDARNHHPKRMDSSKNSLGSLNKC